LLATLDQRLAGRSIDVMINVMMINGAVMTSGTRFQSW
jgi:hypothetical protein